MLEKVEEKEKEKKEKVMYIVPYMCCSLFIHGTRSQARHASTYPTATWPNNNRFTRPRIIP